MNDALAVRALKSIGDLDTCFQCLIDRKRPAGEPRGQRLALQELHHQKVDAILVSDVVEGADIGMGQRGDRSSLAVQPLPPFGA